MRSKVLIALSLVAAFIVGAAANGVTTKAFTPPDQQAVVATRAAAAPAVRTHYVAPRTVTVAETEPRAVVVQKHKRSWEREALIVGGSAGAGAAIGAAAGGKKGAGIGAISGGVAGLIYDLATRNK